MFPSDDVTETKINPTDTDSTTMACSTKGRATADRDSTKDAGRVRIGFGMGMMRFDSTKDSGRARIGFGMGMLRF